MRDVKPTDSTVPFTDLTRADLTVDRWYDGGTSGTAADDPLAKLLPVGNQGGFRYKGSVQKGTVRLAALFSTAAEPDWPDSLDPQTGVFTYYGDNRKPGHELHDTTRSGNLLLRNVFELSHGSTVDRKHIPPFFLFERTAVGRRMTFRGLLAPGTATMTSDDELVAIWRTTGGRRFQNYRSYFTVLDVGRIPRGWIDDILNERTLESPHCPEVWNTWVEARRYTPLVAPTTTIIRSRIEQLPNTAVGEEIIQTIHQHFAARPHDFEQVAVALWRMFAPRTGECDVTRPSRDGGRDAIGSYVVGPDADPIAIDFALEAKCYAMTSSVGVKEVARLISRLRHRHFGVFITTSYFHGQVYSEVRADEHPIAMICARDIVNILRSRGYADVASVRRWLEGFG